jgi:hypothetical protein
MTKRNIIIGAAVVVVIIGWAAFRPEKLFTSSRVDESLPAAAAVAQAGTASSATAPMASLKGAFHSNAHETKGTAAVYTQADGSRILRLADFSTSDGPDVHVYLVAANDVQKDALVKQAGFVDLGSLKATQGNQNYTIPADVDLAKYRAATIWCKRFNVNFGTAPLAASSSGM